MNIERARGGNWTATDADPRTDADGRRRRITDVFSIASESPPPLPADLEIAYLNSPLQFALHGQAWRGLCEVA